MQMQQRAPLPNTGRGGPVSTSQAAGPTGACGSRAARCHVRSGSSCRWRAQQQRRKLECMPSAAAGKGFGSTPKNAQPGSHKGAKEERLDFQDLMITWDKTLEHLYEDPDTASTLLHTAHSSYQQQGRGCVFVRAEVADRFRRHKAATIAQQGTPLSCDADLLLTSWSCNYIPAGELQQLGGLQAAGPSSIAVPVAGDLMEQGSSVELIAQLQRAMRGMDPQQLFSMVGTDADQVASAAASSGGRQYDPKAGELAVVLLARVNGVPAIGADLAKPAHSRNGEALRLVSDELPEEWQ